MVHYITAKEALLMLKLGAKIKRSVWDSSSYITLFKDSIILVSFLDGHTIITDTVEGFLAQKWTDWEVYCPQDNK